MVTFDKLGNYGKLGNQLFQISATYAHAIRHGFDTIFPEWKYNRYLKTQINTSPSIPNLRVFHERDPFSYSPIPPDDNINLHGYFQNEKYFIDKKKEIIDIFTAADHVQDIIDKWLEEFKSENLTSVHIRRGDYLNFPEHHPLPSLDYYFKSIEYLNKDTEQYVIFSDDINWCKQVFPNNFYFSEEKDEFIDLLKMSKCKNHIIANSSFSWWGSFLSNKDGKIFAPPQWVGSGYRNTGWKEVYRKEMIIL